MAHILIVDDEQMIAVMLREMLRREGYTAAIALSGAEGLEMAEVSHPDLVVSDVRMPGMDGFELIGHLNRRLPETVCILMSGHAFSMAEDSYKELEGLQVAATLRKPFPMGVFLQKVRESLDRMPGQGSCVAEVASTVAQQCA